MKTLNSILPAALVAAIVLAPVSVELAVSVALIAGLSALMLGEYGQDHSSVALRA